MSMIKPLMISLISISLLASCTSSPHKTNYAKCELPERDLTVAWHQRSYWCAPKGFKPVILPAVTPATTQNRNVQSTSVNGSNIQSAPMPRAINTVNTKTVSVERQPVKPIEKTESKTTSEIRLQAKTESKKS